MHSRQRRAGVVIAATVLTAVAALTGCSSNSGDSGGGTATITVSNWDGTINDDVVAAFEEANPDIKVKAETYADNYSQKIQTMVTGGNAPDVMLLWEADMLKYAKSGVLEPLDAQAEEAGLTSDKFIPAVKDLLDQTGETYAFAWCYAPELLFYNKDLFDAAGVAYPTADWTWDDFEKAAVELTGTFDGQEVYGTDALTQAGVWYSMAGEAGDEVVDNDGNLVLGEGIEKALEFQNRLTNEQNASPAPQTGSSVADLFGAGRAAMTRTGSWSITGYKDATFNWDIVPLPSDGSDYTTLHTGFYTVYNKSAHKDAAWKFIEFMMSEEGQTLTSSITNNPSAVTAYSDSDAWRNGGTSGPTNWDAITEAAEDGSFGYTLADPTTTTNLANDFNSYLLGVESLSGVMSKVEAAAGR